MNENLRSIPIYITGGEAACCAGVSIEQIRSSSGALRPLSELGLKNEFANIYAGWIADHGLLNHRRYAPASALAVRLAQKAVAQRGWTREEIESACVFAGSSRGNLAGWLEDWPGRSPRRIYAASNNLHSEIAAAVSIELGARGATQVLASGCSAGLDAIGMAALWLKAGLAQRAIVVSVDLPLVTPLLRVFRDSGLLSSRSRCDPYAPDTDGFHPAEAGAVLLLERGEVQEKAWCRIAGWWTTTDAYDPIGAPQDGSGIRACFEKAFAELSDSQIALLCPHANGTPAQAHAEIAALASLPQKPPLWLSKAVWGHSLGASGALDAVVLADALHRGVLTTHPRQLTAPSSDYQVVESASSLNRGGVTLNMSVGMGGHNALLAMESVLRG